MRLVEVRCYRCGGLLATVDTPPVDWSESLSFVRCRKCDLPSPGRIVDVLISSGRDSFPTTGKLPWKMLRASIAKAQRTGRTQKFEARVLEATPDEGDAVP